MAESKGIAFHTNIQIPEKIPISPTDICIIWGNILDNAIEACERLPKANREIRLSIIWEKDSIICKIVNPNPNTDNPMLKTTKKDKEHHGIGLDSVQKTLSKYHGVSRIQQTKEEFIFSFIILIN